MKIIKVMLPLVAISKETNLSKYKKDLSAHLITNTPLPQLTNASECVTIKARKTFTCILVRKFSKTETELINTMPLPQLK